jgi:hypothetical protein
MLDALEGEAEENRWHQSQVAFQIQQAEACLETQRKGRKSMIIELTQVEREIWDAENDRIMPNGNAGDDRNSDAENDRNSTAGDDRNRLSDAENDRNSTAGDDRNRLSDAGDDRNSTVGINDRNSSITGDAGEVNMINDNGANNKSKNKDLSQLRMWRDTLRNQLAQIICPGPFLPDHLPPTTSHLCALRS